MFCVFGPVFVRLVHPLCYQAFEISVYNIELAPGFKVFLFFLYEIEI